MTLQEINKTYEELEKEMNGLKAVRDSLLTFYDVLNKPLPSGIEEMIVSATKTSQEYRDRREMFVNRVNNYESRLNDAGYSKPIIKSILNVFWEFLKKN